MNKIFKTFLMGATLLSLGVAFDAEAYHLDTYRQLLVNNKFTLKYENITPMPRKTNKDKVHFYGFDGMAVDKAHFLTNRQFDGTIVMNGVDKYEEVGYENMSMCNLTKGDKAYFFTKHFNGKKTTYYGDSGKKNKVSAHDKNMQAISINGQSYADPVMTRLLTAILPPSHKSADMPVYKYVDSGWLDNGLSYEDYRANIDGTLEAIRYYFNGNKLVKIAAASYYVLPDGKLDGNKAIIKIKEFTANPDVSYLNLPAGVKDVTKKPKKAKK
ncbi:MAG: hypothetical protein IJ963_00200 [Phascolarctobacterium sp.]|nr:hypothetical protein [Phascolarctobacterium sp.]